MSVATLRTKAEKRGRRGLTAAHRVTTRGVTYAKGQVGDLATQGERLTRSVDGQIKQYTGRRSAAWIDGASRLVGNHLGMAFTVVAALAVYALFALLV